jgi:RAB protein geranylgeranyltransferase component A
VCAVFGGTYILDCDVVEFEQSNDEKRVTALKLDDGQRITFEHLITSADYLPTPWQSNIIKQQR